MEAVLDFIKILIPSALVLYAMYLTVRSFINKERDEKILHIKTKNTETITPIRLQAYERMVLFLERINPNNLLVRINKANLTANEFHHVLLNEVREEFNHNMSQQLYMSDEAWELIRHAKEEVISLVNNCAQQLNGESTATELSKAIFTKLIEEQKEPTAAALRYIKEEVRINF